MNARDIQCSFVAKLDPAKKNVRSTSFLHRFNNRFTEDKWQKEQLAQKGKGRTLLSPLDFNTFLQQLFLTFLMYPFRNFFCECKSIYMYIYICIYIYIHTHIQVVLVVKNLPANVGSHLRDVVRFWGQKDSPGGRHGNPLQYSCLENPMDREGWRDNSPQGHTESDMTEATQHASKHAYSFTMDSTMYIILCLCS